MIAALVEVSLGMAAAGGCVAVGRRATLPGVDPGQILAIRWRGEGEGERSASGARAAKALCAALARCRPRSAAPCRDGAKQLPPVKGELLTLELSDGTRLSLCGEGGALYWRQGEPVREENGFREELCAVDRYEVGAWALRRLFDKAAEAVRLGERGPGETVRGDPMSRLAAYQAARVEAVTMERAARTAPVITSGDLDACLDWLRGLRPGGPVEPAEARTLLSVLSGTGSMTFTFSGGETFGVSAGTDGETALLRLQLDEESVYAFCEAGEAAVLDNLIRGAEITALGGLGPNAYNSLALEDAPGGGLEGAARELVLRHFRLYTDQDDLLEEFRPLELQVRRVTVTAPTGREDFSAVAEFDLLPGGEAGRAYFSAAWGGRADADGWLRSCLMPMRIGLGTWDGRECYSVLSYRTQEAWSPAGPDQAA